MAGGETHNFADEVVWPDQALVDRQAELQELLEIPGNETRLTRLRHELGAASFELRERGFATV